MGTCDLGAIAASQQTISTPTTSAAYNTSRSQKSDTHINQQTQRTIIDKIADWRLDSLSEFQIKMHVVQRRNYTIHKKQPNRPIHAY